MPNSKMLPFVATALMLFAIPAFADDPAMYQDGSSCPGGGAWCGSSTEAIDSTTGIDTLEYIFSSEVVASNPNDYAGWVEGEIGGTEAELLHFVVVSPGEYGVFLYCGGYQSSPGVGVCSSDDDYLPLSENSQITSSNQIFNMASSYYNPGDGSSDALPGAGTYNAGSGPNSIGYSVLYSASGTHCTACTLVGTVPEASSVVELGAMLIGLAAFVGMKFSART